MKTYYQTYKQNIFQIIGLAIGYILFRKIILFYLAISLLVLLVLMPKIALKFIKHVDKFIKLLGVIIKSILLFFIFCFVIIPISLLMRWKKKSTNVKSTSNYIKIDNLLNTYNFEKMW